MKKLLAAIAVVGAVAGCGSSTGQSNGMQPTDDPVTAINSFTPATDEPSEAPSPVETITPAPSQGPLAVQGVTALLADPATISTHFQPADIAQCVAAEDEQYPLGHRAAWTVDGALVCGDYSDTTWHGHIVTFNVYFVAPATQEAALAVVQQLLPSDAAKASQVVAGNQDESSHPDGGCDAVTYTSAISDSALTALSPDWKVDGKDNAFLYSSVRTGLEDGATTPYSPDTVRFASVGIGTGEGVLC